MKFRMINKHFLNPWDDILFLFSELSVYSQWILSFEKLQEYSISPSFYSKIPITFLILKKNSFLTLYDDFEQ